MMVILIILISLILIASPFGFIYYYIQYKKVLELYDRKLKKKPTNKQIQQQRIDKSIKSLMNNNPNIGEDEASRIVNKRIENTKFKERIDKSKRYKEFKKLYKP